MAAPVDDQRLLAARLEAQLLRSRGASRTEEVLERLLAVQAQDLRGARLAVRSRSTVEAAVDVDDALTDRRSAVVGWLCRGTLHLVGAEDYRWLHALTAPRLRSGIERRLRQLGVDAAAEDRGVDTIARAVAERGPRTRGELCTALDAAGVPTEGQALVHLLAAASLRGLIVRGPMRDGEHAFVDVDEWLGPAPDPLEEAEALARLARRYLAGHGPAGAEDLAKWAGIPLGRARAGLSAIDEECTAVVGGLVRLATSPAPDAGEGAVMPAPSLLGAFDPVLHGWLDRTFITGDHKPVVTTNGLFRPIALVGGRVAGIWSLADGTLRLQLLEPVADADLQALSGEAAAVLRYLGLPARDMIVA
ncbi:MAG TPA: winged helix DNA-binding domain-containing protein [Acidimicrobiales bacterium]|nr:winged helix DNA-binding domain-containing protein [Acidimicrobiales bacterium]